MEVVENRNPDLESEATPVREVQGTLNCQRGIRGLNGAIVAAAAVTEARGSDNARALTGYTQSARETVYRLNLVQFHPAEKDQVVSS